MNARLIRPDKYDDFALDQRVTDFNVVRNWVFAQMQGNPGDFSRRIACMLVGGNSPDWRTADAEAVDSLRTQMNDAVAEQPETIALAAELRDQAEEEAEEAEREARENARYEYECNQSIPQRW